MNLLARELAKKLADREAAIQRVRKWHAEHCDECNDTGPCPTIRALDGSNSPPGTSEITGPLIDPDCRDGKHSSCVGGPCECPCHELAMRG